MKRLRAISVAAATLAGMLLVAQPAAAAPPDLMRAPTCGTLTSSNSFQVRCKGGVPGGWYNAHAWCADDNHEWEVWGRNKFYSLNPWDWGDWSRATCVNGSMTGHETQFH